MEGKKTASQEHAFSKGILSHKSQGSKSTGGDAADYSKELY